MSNPFVGVWEFRGGPFSGRCIFTEKHYAVVAAESDRKTFQNDPPTQEEQAHAFAALAAHSGTYSVEGNVISFHRDVARDPTTVGEDEVAEYKIDGDRLSLKHQSGSRGVRPQSYPEIILQKVS